MSWRIVTIDSTAKLDLSQHYLVVRQGHGVTKIFIDEIQTLIVESTAVSLTAALLAELTKAKVKIIFCDEKHCPASELVPYNGAHDSARKMRAQAKWTEERKETVWTAIVTEKIHKQQQLLAHLGNDRHQQLTQYCQSVVAGDATNREGQAARVYFSALFGLNFTRARDCAVNAALDYGYSILLAAFSREIVACGYCTQLGISHDSVYNAFNLSSDLMEPYRPLIDACVYEMKTEIFGKEEKHCLIDVLNHTVIMNNRHELVSNAIHRYCLSVFDAIDTGDISALRFYDYEL